MAVSRRNVLVAGTASGLAVAAGFPGEAVAAVPSGFVSAADLGVTPTSSAATNRANLVSALSGSSSCVLFPPGDYMVDNAGDALVIPGFGGQLSLLPGARFVLTDNASKGFVFQGGTGARLSGFTVTYRVMPAVRVAAKECVMFDASVDTYLERTRIDGSAAAGLLFWQCVRPMAVDAVIRNTMADGLHFANCQDGRADHVTTSDTGDDGVAFINYATNLDQTRTYPNYTGGLATNLSITRSKSRGVAVGGQSGVTVRDVTIDSTVGHGICCDGGDSTWRTRIPSGTRLERIRITRGGAWTEGGASGANAGLRIGTSGTTVVQDVVVESAAAHGVYCSNATVTLLDVAIRTVGGSPGNGCSLQSGAYLLDRVTTENTNGIGVTASGCERLEYGTVTVRNAAKTHPTHRALNVENTPFVFGGRLWVYDTQNAPTGYVVGAYGSQRGALGTVIDGVAARDLVIDNASSIPVSRL
jgi:hypothetical protein